MKFRAVVAPVTFLETLGIDPAQVAARGLQACHETTELEISERGTDGREHLMTPDAANAWRRLKSAAEGNGITLFIVSAFHSIERQAAIIERKLARGQSLRDLLMVLAPPDYSEHHTGRAVDIGTSGCIPAQAAFELTDAFRWLERHAFRYGFVMSYPHGNAFGYQYEPWHWSYRPSRPNRS